MKPIISREFTETHPDVLVTCTHGNTHAHRTKTTYSKKDEILQRMHDLDLCPSRTRTDLPRAEGHLHTW